MNILFLDQFSDPGGGQFCLQALMPEILRRGWRPRLMAPGSGALLDWSRRRGVPADFLPLSTYSSGAKSAFDFLKFGFDAPRVAAAIRRAVRNHSIDLAYVNGPRVLPFVTGLSCRVVFHAHSLVSVFYGAKLIELTLKVTGAKVLAASDFVARTYREKLGEDRVRVVYNGVDDLAREPRSFQRRPLRIGIVGRIAPEKGHLDFVRTAMQIADRGCDAEFLIYGERLFSDSRYDRAVRALAANAPVTFCGWTDDVARALHGLDILAVPSGSVEASPRVILEAFSAGTPVVAYRVGGIPEIVEHGRTGLLTDARTPDSLTRSIQLLMGDPALRERLSAAGRAEWQRRFTIEAYRKQICDLVEADGRLRVTAGQKLHAVESR